MALKGMTAICFLLLVGIVVCVAAMIRMGREMEAAEKEKDRYKQCLESMLLWFSRLRKDITRCPTWYRVEDNLPKKRGCYLALTGELEYYVCDFIPSVQQWWGEPGDELLINVTEWTELPPAQEEGRRRRKANGT